MASQFWPTFGQTSRVRQILAYHNSPAIWGEQPGNFLEATAKGMSNRQAWLTTMANRPGVGHNSPSLLTLGATPADANAYHSSARRVDLHGLWNAPPEDANTYVSSYLDYGCGPCGCPDPSQQPFEWLDVEASAVLIGQAALTVDETVPVLRLSRKQRSPAEIEDRVGISLEIMGLEAVSDASITEWAADAMATPARASVLRLDVAGVEAWALYSPHFDDLTILADRPAGDAVIDNEIDRDKAAARFDDIVAQLEAAGLTNNLTNKDPRVGVLVTQVGKGPTVESERVDGWRFGVNRSFAGVTILDSGVSAVVDSDGELSMLRLTDVSVDYLDLTEVRSDPVAVEAQWLDALSELHNAPDWVFLDSLRIAYALPPDAVEAELEPRLVVNYVLGYEHEGSVTPSRQNISSVPVMGIGEPALFLPEATP